MKGTVHRFRSIIYEYPSFKPFSKWMYLRFPYRLFAIVKRVQFQSPFLTHSFIDEFDSLNCHSYAYALIRRKIWQRTRRNGFHKWSLMLHNRLLRPYVYTNAGSFVRRRAITSEQTYQFVRLSFLIEFLVTTDINSKLKQKMNNFVRAALRSSPLKALTMPLQQRFGVQNAGFTRSLWHMSKTPSTIKYIEKNSMGCTCGCGARFAHTDGKHWFTQIYTEFRPVKSIFIGLNVHASDEHNLNLCRNDNGTMRLLLFPGEKELVNFLQEEVAAEKKIQSQVKLPTQVNGFQVKFDGADVELTKQTANETWVVLRMWAHSGILEISKLIFILFSVLVKFNVNHTVDSDEPEVFENEQNEGKKHESEESDHIKSKPNFEVDIVRNGTTLSFTCSFLPGEPVEGEYGKTFHKNPTRTRTNSNIVSFWSVFQTTYSASKSWPFSKVNSVARKCTHVLAMCSMGTYTICWWTSWKRKASPMNSVPKSSH